MNCDSVILVDLVSSDSTVSSHIFGFTSESEEEEVLLIFVWHFSFN
jgi:hypothetical protein